MDTHTSVEAMIIVSPPAVSLDCLPSDLLALIVRLVPLRPRLMILSLVCKRWRRLCLQTIDRLPSLSDGPLCSALRVLPNVTSLGCPLPPSLPRLPSTLRELTLLSHVWYHRDLTQRLYALPTLTSLDMRGLRFAGPLLLLHSTSITKLSLLDTTLASAPHIFMISFPHLRTLRLPFDSSAGVESWLFLHLIHLSELSLSARAPPSASRVCPLLRSLRRLEVPGEHSDAWLRLLLPLTVGSVRLCIHASSALSTLPDAHADLRPSLELLSSTPESLDALTRRYPIVSLDSADTDLHLYRSLAPHLTALTRLSLALHHVTGGDCLALPSLTSLTLRLPPTRPDAVCAGFLAASVACMPRLRLLCVWHHWRTLSGPLRVVGAAAAAGVEELVLYADPAVRSALLRTLASRCYPTVYVV